LAVIVTSSLNFRWFAIDYGLNRSVIGLESGAKRVYTHISSNRYSAAIFCGGSGCAPVPSSQRSTWSH